MSEADRLPVGPDLLADELQVLLINAVFALGASIADDWPVSGFTAAQVSPPPPMAIRRIPSINRPVIRIVSPSKCH